MIRRGISHKNDKLPRLIEKEVSLKQATYIEEKIIYLANQKDILLEKHKELTRKYKRKELKCSLLLMKIKQK